MKDLILKYRLWHLCALLKKRRVHSSVKIWNKSLVNIYDSDIGEGTTIANFVEIGGVKIGKFCKIHAFASICSGTVIEDNVFIAPHVVILDDKHPTALKSDWTSSPVTIKRGASIGGGAIILPGVTIGEKAVIGAGSVVVKDVPPNTTVICNPARELIK